MFINNKTATAVRFALIAGVAGTTITTPTAFAAEDAAVVERIAVTGSRIKRSDMETASPVTIIDATAIAATGATSLGEVLQNMSAAGGAMTNPGINNDSGGNSNINLRGLGSERTLVLVNGRRMIASGTGAAASVDLNTIPIAMVQRVEILKDGASAVYGTDAVSGVVNIILKRDFEGFEMSTQTGSSFEGDAEETTLDFTIGASSDKGNVVIGVQYTDRGDASQGDRDFSDCPLFDNTDEDGLATGGTYCGGSPSSVGGHVYGENAELSGRGEDNSGFHDFDKTSDDNDYYNYSEASYLSTPMQRLNLTAIGNYQVTDEMSFFAEAMYTKRWSESQMAPEPVKVTTVYDSSWMNEELLDHGIEDGETVTYRRRLDDSGPRITSHNVDTIRIVFGLEGELENEWTWDISYNKGKNDSVETTENLHYMTGVENDIEAGTFDPFLQDSWQGEEFDQYKFTEVNVGGSEMDIFAASLAGELFELPAGVVGFAAGIEHRLESAFFTPGSMAQQGLGADDPVEATSGSFNVNEAYVEFAVPLLADAPYAEHVELSAAVRYFDYSTFGSDSTWKLGLTWKVNDQLMLRSVASTAFRAPTVDELYGGTGVSYDDVSHKANDSGQALVTVGSNSELTPEEAETLTVGAVYEPEAIEGLSFTLDYYEIEITDAIEKIDSNYLANTCLTDDGIQQNNHLEMCQTADISVSAGQVEFTNLKGNIGTIETSGIDFNIAYVFEAAGLNFRTGLDTTYLLEYKKDIGDVIDYKGMITGSEGSYAKLKLNYNLNVRADDWSANYSARYIDSMDDISCDPGMCYVPSVGSVVYHDIAGAYHVNETVTLSGGINNLLDKDAPYYSNNNDSNTDPYTYDVIGRYGFVKVNVRF